MAKMTIGEITYEGTAVELADLVREFGALATEQAVVTAPETLKVGDYAKALTTSEFGEIKAGEIVEITDLDASYPDDPHSIEGETETKTCYFRPQDLVKVDAPTKPNAPKPKVGDIVVITANTNGSVNKVGDIGKVVEGEYNDEINAAVQVTGGETFSNFTLFTEMRLATPAEIERYTKDAEDAQRAEVFTKAGRKVDEYKKGDIVRYLGNSTMKGSLAEVEEDSEGYGIRIITQPSRFAPVSTERPEDITPIAFVESRVDAK
ncbi:hypothetical protein I2483_13795 [Sporosarcina sp. E16_3]|uniref:hypothetical protein n=1 Tax=Sporosarcina sp. E16_3 TaxID=2789293 RepID=UPI001A915D93|nr:hypothetical protein [Sporosarcina sp. E16_3]MBO0602736.1 hypothetical protein [Sporosarcina sp. E16_3]